MILEDLRRFALLQVIREILLLQADALMHKPCCWAFRPHVLDNREASWPDEGGEG